LIVHKWAIAEEVPTRCANTGPAITRRNFEVHVMQLNHNIIQILDVRGEVIGTMTLPSHIKLSDLAPLRILGAVSINVLPDTYRFEGVIVGGVQ
jgi:hypothetical protein